MNAQKSTGPRTAEGKAVSRLNALKWGLCATEIAMLPGEDPEQFDALRSDLHEYYKPAPGAEEALVDHLASLLWRLARVYRIETGIFAWYLRKSYLAARTTARLGSMMANAMAGERPAQLGADVVIDEDMADEEVEELVDMFEDRGDAVVDLGRAFVADAQKANALGKLSRYETSLLRSVERTQRQLEDLQAARSGKTD
jgi:hypothetical protein